MNEKTERRKVREPVARRASSVLLRLMVTNALVNSQRALLAAEIAMRGRDGERGGAASAL
jgi:hypothetical protein